MSLLDPQPFPFQAEFWAAIQGKPLWETAGRPDADGWIRVRLRGLWAAGDTGDGDVVDVAPLAPLFDAGRLWLLGAMVTSGRTVYLSTTGPADREAGSGWLVGGFVHALHLPIRRDGIVWVRQEVDGGGDAAGIPIYLGYRGRADADCAGKGACSCP